jgi:pimeloyl-ACP methyl ester carboxylesterase
MSTQNKNTGRTTSGLIDVGATTLYHEVRGSGPPLLLITGSTGDAGEWAQVAPTLAEDYTVITYDRRGFSRSPQPDGWGASSAAEQADDAAALLRALDLTPAVVVGHSAGGSIACSLVVRHPELVRHAVLYEPPLLAVVPDSEQIVAGMRATTDQAMAEGGPRAAMEAFMRGVVGDEVADMWFQMTDPAEQDRVLDNGTVRFGIEMPWVTCFVPDRDGMRASGVPLTVVAGADNPHTWFGAAAAWLAEGTGADRVELPGGHVGFVTHPQAFVALVRRCAQPA